MPPSLEPEDLAGRIRFGKLALGGDGLTDAKLLRIVADGPYPTVTELAFDHGAYVDLSACALLTSAAFPSLLTLELTGSRVTAEIAHALASAAHLRHLEILGLGEVCKPGEPGLDEAGVRLLARAPGLPSLARIERTREWRFGPDAREEREVVRIAREDGRVVESVIEHHIWP